VSSGSITLAQPPLPLGGFNQYVLYSPNPDRPDEGIPLLDLEVTIYISEPLVVSEGSPPISFQINGSSLTNPRGLSPSSTGWQQCGILMQPGSTQLSSFGENWPWR
jgi:hypothetical protein